MSTVIDGSASVTINSGAVLGITSGTAVASTSGTSIDFTSIPSWVKRITVMFSGVSLSASANILIQLGSGSVQTTGYLSAASFLSASATTSNSTSGLIVTNNSLTANLYQGTVTISSFGSNTWASQGVLGVTSGATAITMCSGGTVALSGTLDRIRITSTSTDTFDAGSINILYE